MTLASLSLVLQAIASDTLVTLRPSPTGLDWWVDLLTSIASIIIAIALIATAIAVIPLALRARRSYRKYNRLLRDLRQRVDPMLRHANDVADNVNYISSAIRTDVAKLQSLIANAEARLDVAADRAEERIEEFNALLKVMQEEAEQLFIGTASTVRGVRASAESLLHPESDEHTDGILEINVQQRREP